MRFFYTNLHGLEHGLTLTQTFPKRALRFATCRSVTVSVIVSVSQC
jgi:hypothetical protein